MPLAAVGYPRHGRLLTSHHQHNDNESKTQTRIHDKWGHAHANEHTNEYQRPNTTQQFYQKPTMKDYPSLHHDDTDSTNDFPAMSATATSPKPKIQGVPRAPGGLPLSQVQVYDDQQNGQYVQPCSTTTKLTSKLFIAGLPEWVNEGVVLEFFWEFRAKIQRVTWAHEESDDPTQKGDFMGYGWVDFDDAFVASQALAACKGRCLPNSNITVEISFSQPKREMDERPPCGHANWSDWKRLRQKNGVQHFVCVKCGCKWKRATGTKKAQRAGQTRSDWSAHDDGHYDNTSFDPKKSFVRSNTNSIPNNTQAYPHARSSELIRRSATLEGNGKRTNVGLNLGECATNRIRDGDSDNNNTRFVGASHSNLAAWLSRSGQQSEDVGDHFDTIVYTPQNQQQNRQHRTSPPSSEDDVERMSSEELSASSNDDENCAARRQNANERMGTGFLTTAVARDANAHSIPHVNASTSSSSSLSCGPQNPFPFLQSCEASAITLPQNESPNNLPQLSQSFAGFSLVNDMPVIAGVGKTSMLSPQLYQRLTRDWFLDSQRETKGACGITVKELGSPMRDEFVEAAAKDPVFSRPTFASASTDDRSMCCADEQSSGGQFGTSLFSSTFFTPIGSSTFLNLCDFFCVIF